MSMKNKITVQHMFEEYFFARCVNFMNETRYKAHMPLLTTSQTRHVHETFASYVESKADGRGLGAVVNDALEGFNRSVELFNGNSRVFTSQALPDGRAAVKTLNPDGSDRGVIIGRERSLEFIRSVKSDFEAMTGIDLKTSAQIDHSMTNTDIAYTRRGSREQPLVMPISPYDERFSMRNTVLNAGAEILCVRCEDVLSMETEDNLAQNRSNPDYEPQGYFLCLNEEDSSGRQALMYRYDPTSSQPLSTAGQLYNEEDRYGLSRLRQYISNNDYKNLLPVVRNWKRVTPMSPAGLDKAVFIFEYLRSKGIAYSVQPDSNDGQLKVRIGNSKLYIRVTESREREQYVGRCYNDGYSSFLSASVYNASYQPGLDRLEAFLDYNLGMSAERESIASSARISRMVGAPAMNSRTNTDDTAFCKNPKTGDYDFRTLFGFDKNAAHTMVKNSDGTMSRPNFVPRVMLRVTNTHSRSSIDFTNPEEAETFLRNAVESAYENFFKEMDIDRLIQEAEEHGQEEGYMPLFSPNPSIGPVQQQYWQILTGAKTTLYMPDMDDAEADLDDAYEEGDDLSIDALIKSIFDSEMTYEGTPAEKVRAHLEDAAALLIGTYDPDENGKRFSPVAVSTFMSSGLGVFRDNDNLVSAMRTVGITGDELLGDDFASDAMKDKLVYFRPETAQRMDELTSPFMKRVYRAIADTLAETGCVVSPENILIDDQGVVHYEGTRKYEEVSGGKRIQTDRPVVGEIGQIFEPDEQRLVETRYGSGKNKLFTPGYMAYVLPQKQGENLSLEERTRYRGYESILIDNIRSTLRHDMWDPSGRIINPVSVNNTYRDKNLLVTRYHVQIPLMEGETLKEAYYRQAELTKLRRDIVDARFETNAGMIRFPSSVRETSSLDRSYRESQYALSASGENPVYVLTNDTILDEYRLMGSRNVGELTEESDGYYDKMATGQAKNQGVTRYAVVGSQFTEDGRLLPAEDKNARTALLYLPEFRYIENMPFDRQLMVFSNVMNCYSVTEPIKFAMATCCGMNLEDSIPISKELAEKYPSISKEGTLQDLVIGDKACSYSGNKGVTPFIVDRNMTPEEIEASPNRELLRHVVPFFKANPDLHFIMSPYSAVSRFNACDALMAMENPSDLHMPDGSVIEGAVGEMPLIITDKTSEHKTIIYEGSEGRSASPLLNLIVSAKGAMNILKEFYGDNNAAVEDYREMMIVTGIDMDETGHYRSHYEPHEGEKRRVFPLPSKEEFGQLLAENGNDVKGASRAAAKMFAHLIEKSGGFLEVPFDLPYALGGRLQPIEDPKSEYDTPMYALPVMSAHLRCGQEFIDGTRMTHDYTNYYATIFECALRYLQAKESDETSRYVQGWKDKAERAFDNISSDVANRLYEGKHNYIRDHIMSKKIPYSSTAVASSNPALDLNQIAMSSEMAKKLDVKEGEMVMVWRDPCLHTSSACGLEVVIDDSLTGVAINPCTAQRMDADFDGDTFAVAALKTPGAKKELRELFSVEATMLNPMIKRENGDLALFFNDGQDFVSAQQHRPELLERYRALEHQVNEVMRSDMSWEEKLAANRRLLCGDPADPTQDSVSRVLKEGLMGEICTAVVSFRDKEAHIKSYEDIVQTGAKGSMSKVALYQRYLEGKTTRLDMVGVEHAIQVKSYGTALGGIATQKIAVVMRNSGALEWAMASTYLCTQRALQSKHDAVGSIPLYNTLQEAVKHLYAGHKMEKYTYVDEIGTQIAKAEKKASLQADFDSGSIAEEAYTAGMKEADALSIVRESWRPVRNEKGEYVQMTPDEWLQTFADMHDSEDGLNVKGEYNMDYVRLVAEALTNPEDGRMYDIEREEVQKKLGAWMDYLGYSNSNNNAARYVEAAKVGAGLYDGRYNQCIAPTIVRENMVAAQEGRPLRPICPPDVLEEHSVKYRTNWGRNTNLSVNMEGVISVKVGGKAAEAEQPVVAVQPVEQDERLETTERTSPPQTAVSDVAEQAEKMPQQDVTVTPPQPEASEPEQAEKVSSTPQKPVNPIDDMSDLVDEDEHVLSERSVKLQQKADERTHQLHNEGAGATPGTGVEGAVPAASTTQPQKGQAPSVV